MALSEGKILNGHSLPQAALSSSRRGSFGEESELGLSFLEKLGVNFFSIEGAFSGGQEENSRIPFHRKNRPREGKKKPGGSRCQGGEKRKKGSTPKKKKEE